jgi:beta-lactamase superfamily II metal-dependent hydrolase
MRHTPADKRLSLLLPALLFTLLLATGAAAQPGNGKLQIHHIDVGQGDGALIISPLGQLALVDDGLYSNCPAFVDYLTGLGITSFDYNFVSHYHADHIGCLDDLLGAGVVLNVAGYDRGYSYTTATYTDYATALGAKRQTLSADQTITLDAGSANPVTIRCIALNGAGVYPVDGDDENAKSVVLRITYGAFDEVMGGDLTADSDNDVESAVGAAVGDVEVYKVHHHASATSTSDSWLTSTTPEVGVISVGDNTYGHPTAEALTRLHNHGVKTYWTEPGSGADPTIGWDKVGGTIVVQADPAPGAAYTVAGDGFTDTWYNSAGSEELLAKTYVPSGVTMLAGAVGAGSYASLAADDGGYLRIDGVKVSKRYYTDWYAGLTVAETPASLTVTYNGHYTQSGTQTLYLYDFTAAAWSQVDAADVGTTDATRSCVIAAPAPFVSPVGEIRIRVARDSSPKAYSCYADYLACTIKYAAPAAAATRIVDAAGPAIATGDHDPSSGGVPCLTGAIEAWPNPFNPRVRLSFELAREVRGRLCVYDVAGRQVATLTDGVLARGTHILVWNGTDARGEALSSGVYVAKLEAEGTAYSRKLVLLR